MQDSIESVQQTSDGVLVCFHSGTVCYFPADFLAEHAGTGSTQIFLDHDPSPQHSACAEIERDFREHPTMLFGDSLS